MSEHRDSAVLEEARLLREEAWQLVRGDVAALRDGLAEKPIGRRIREHAADEIVETIDMARDIASENKAVVGLTIAAVAGWLLRAPLSRIAGRWLAGMAQGE
ncbi:hypothetical protein [Novosphingobium sp. EMRT-2]|uniref:hypothetical protein n=1 Tax=Novosphingobium sp. EMRT-2 TaxID=2571749 RepID=UPI0010BD3B4C|nr:hypothetical protein [Novosphingobium sp. EMRT-2]QCI92811.1 hypothetical protein FA702_04065 [Novosphingobium sp. EMRT-2]